jgi:hypothetical protein
MAKASALRLAGIWLALATAVTPAAAQTRGAAAVLTPSHTFEPWSPAS